MSAFSGVLNTWKLPALPHQAADSRLEIAVEQAIRRMGASSVDAPPAAALGKAHAEVQALAQSGWNGGVSRKSLRYAPWAIYYTDSADETPLIGRRGFLKAFLDWFQKHCTVRAALNLATVYLERYDPESVEQELMRAYVLNILRKRPEPKAVQFLERAERWQLLEKKGSAKCAAAFTKSDLSPSEFLYDAGLTAQLAAGGFVEDCLIRMSEEVGLRILRGGVSTGDVERLLALASDDRGVSLRFGPRTSGKVAEALLLPFENQNPTQELRSTIEPFLLSRFGDPRIQPGPWRTVGETAVAIFRRWLVSETIEDFFRLLDANAKFDRQADRHWKYRRAFWSAYLKNGYIDDAWVALGSKVRVNARKYLSSVSGSYADLTGAQPNHAVLLMRIGVYTITEWSHSGKYRLWELSSKSAPKLYQNHYQREALVSRPDFEGSHHGSDNGRWQGTLSDYLREHTGVAIHHRDLMPR